MAEYLKDFQSDLIKGIRWQDILKNNKPIDRITLSAVLQEAREFLTTEPGPNLQRRIRLEPSWIGYWINSLSTIKDTGVLTPLENIKERLAPEESSGVLYAGGFEGHPGHRRSVDWMAQHVDKSILLFEQDWFIKQKSRLGRFLPLEVRISMWAHYNPNLIISVMPQPHNRADLDAHYRKILESTGATYCFAWENDPLALRKISRGRQAHFTLIPSSLSESTTIRVQGLMPDRNLDDLVPKLKK